jgi:hypothetical protein
MVRLARPTGTRHITKKPRYASQQHRDPKATIVISRISKRPAAVHCGDL